MEGEKILDERRFLAGPRKYLSKIINNYGVDFEKLSIAQTVLERLLETRAIYEGGKTVSGREIQIHVLKTVTRLFDDVWTGRKRFEIRKGDRDYTVGDILHLVEVTEEGEPIPSVRFIIATISYILPLGEVPGLGPLRTAEPILTMGLREVKRYFKADQGIADAVREFPHLDDYFSWGPDEI